MWTNITLLKDVSIRQKHTTHSFHYNDECSSIFFFFLKLFPLHFWYYIKLQHSLIHTDTNKKISDLLSLCMLMFVISSVANIIFKATKKIYFACYGKNYLFFFYLTFIKVQIVATSNIVTFKTATIHSNVGLLGYFKNTTL